ncbi:MAG TPA: dihydrodipicolinate synthase family protein [Nitrososphaerales archaeon]|nr:dihydrodipicolinate synthase family protein [Nitrososphaerales archaeon]
MARVRKQKIGGLFTALITAFDDKGRVDAERMTNLVRFQISKGVDGLYPCGSTGLGPMLSPDERKAVAEAVIEEASGKIPVVVQVGSADTASSIELAKHAEKTGATAVASLTPYYYKPGDRAVFKHFEAISKSVSIPTFAYNIPQFTGNNLQPSALAAMAKAGIIAGIKDSSRDFLHLLDLLDAVPDDFVVMNGTEEYGLFALMSGADGLISGGASALPEPFVLLVAAQRGLSYDEALAAQETVLKLKDVVRTGAISSYYEILRERGIECGKPRIPLLPTEPSEAKRIIAELKELRLI